ncbi:MAG: transposase [bacterium]|nr:transposase [bacterium]
MPRTARLIAVGYPHYVTQRGNNRQQIFLNDRDRENYVALLQEHSKECLCSVYAYCLMENHVHLVLFPKRKYSLAKMMQKISLRYTQYFNNKYRKTGRLWECRFHSAIVDPAEYLWAVCRYAERNPCRQRIVVKAQDYPWSSARFRYSDEHNKYVKQFLKTFEGQQKYAEYLNEYDNPDDVQKIRKSAISSLPIGSDEFIISIERITGISLKRRPRGRPPKKITE